MGVARLTPPPLAGGTDNLTPAKAQGDGSLSQPERGGIRRFTAVEVSQLTAVSVVHII